LMCFCRKIRIFLRLHFLTQRGRHPASKRTECSRGSQNSFTAAVTPLPMSPGAQASPS
jgi:hypothetical protein